MSLKITLSKKRAGEKRHVVLVCDPNEAREIEGIIRVNVLEPGVWPDRERIQSLDMVRFRFAMKYLDRLMLTFPFAEFSPGLASRLSRQAKEALDAMPVPDLTLPNFLGELYRFQKIGVGKICERNKYLLNDDLGLGKTIQAMASIIERQAFPALVVVPNSLKFNWLNMVHQFTDLNCIVVDGSKAQRAEQICADADITVINHEGLRTKRYRDPERLEDYEDGEYEYVHVNPDLFDIEWAMVVVDEYHQFKNPDAQQTIGLHMLTDAPFKLGMSGTPILNGRPEEYWSILHWQYPRRFPSQPHFIEKHCIREGGKVVAYRGLHEFRDFINPRSLRRRKDQVLEDLPEVQHIVREVTMTAEQWELYRSIEEDLILWVEEEARRVPNALAQMTRLLQACFSPELYDGSHVSAKIDMIKADVAELVANGHKAIIFSEWAKATRILQRELAQYNPAYVDGSVKVSQGRQGTPNFSTPRQDQVDKFNNDDDCHLFIGTIGSCKQGFTLGAADYVLMAGEDWVPANNQQAIGRSAAGGLRGVGVEHVTVLYYRCHDTIEPRRAEVVARKQQMNDRMTENDAGAKVDRITMGDIREILGLSRDD